MPGLPSIHPGATFGPRLLHDFEFVWIIDGYAKAGLMAGGGGTAGTVLLGRPGMTDR